METAEVTNIRTPEQDEKFATTFKAFIRDYLRMSNEDRKALGMGGRFEMDISDPHMADMEAILGEEDFEVKNIVSSPRSDESGAKNYSLYAGNMGDPRTEFHISQGAADVLTQRLSTPSEEPAQ